ncbi:MAG TPA: LuxR C-terminal-related transcriptional regulator [Anaerolineae bacterium]|nr:LuxR C-terminal-related transcriptional regulator [Anaerolineae bacterium]
MTGLNQSGDKISAVAMLSSQQIDVLRLVAKGLTYREVANALHLSQRAVQYHMDQIKDKLDVASRAEAITQAVGLGVIDATLLSDHRLKLLADD